MITLALTKQEVQIIMQALSTQPWHLVHALLPKIDQQVRECVAPVQNSE